MKAGGKFHGIGGEGSGVEVAVCQSAFHLLENASTDRWPKVRVTLIMALGAGECSYYGCNEERLEKGVRIQYHCPF